MKPKRIQLSRAKGWRKPAGVIVVSRPSKWGNPYQVVKFRGGFAVRGNGNFTWSKSWTIEDARAYAVDRFRGRIGGTRARQAEIELAGRDLACWCPPTSPCHADVLLEIANSAHLWDSNLNSVSEKMNERFREGRT